MQTWPSVTVVVPSYNQGQYIGATLQSIIDQKHPSLELLVIDGGSTDNSVEEIKKFSSHIKYWVSEPDGGQTAAINKGFTKSTNEIMAWINSDDLVTPDAFNHIMSYFAENPNVDVLYGNRILIDGVGLEIGRWIIPYHSDAILKWADFVPQETLYWRRSAWNKIGARLDEDFRFAMDWDFLLRLTASGVRMAHLPLFLGLFRVHQSQKTSSQMSSVGQIEMEKLRLRELGFIPTRWQLMKRTIPFLLLARTMELIYSVRAMLGVK
jgi:glycosyltransferase involved in cell wall biosynthesis